MIRPVTDADSAGWHALRNEPDVRFWSQYAQPIPLEAHTRWWLRMRGNPEIHYLAVAQEPGHAPLNGYGRLQQSIDAEVSVGVRREARQSGIGTAMLAHLETQARAEGVDRLVAYVQVGNVPSIALFQKAGYVMGTPPSYLQLVKVL